MLHRNRLRVVREEAECLDRGAVQPDDWRANCSRQVQQAGVAGDKLLRLLQDRRIYFETEATGGTDGV